MVAASRANGVTLLAGHTRSLSIWNRAMRRIALSGQIGGLRAIHIAAHRLDDSSATPDELDPNQGGGIVFRQGPHQIDTLRLLGGGMLRSVRGMTGKWLDARPIPGYFTAYLEFEDGTPATIMHNGYGILRCRRCTHGCVTSANIRTPTGPRCGAISRAAARRVERKRRVSRRRDARSGCGCKRAAAERYPWKPSILARWKWPASAA